MLKVLACVFSIFALATTAFPAEVKKISKKTGAIYINEGSTKGFVKGIKVCLFDLQTKIACGRVSKAVKRKAIIRVPKSKVDKIRTGFTVSVQGGGERPKPGPADTSMPPAPFAMSITLNLHFLPLTPATYENLNYVAPGGGSASEWSSIGTASNLLLPPAFGFEFELIDFKMLVGFRYGIYGGSSQADYYDTTQPNLTLTTDTQASDIGIYFDYTYYKMWDINFQVGLDLDMTSVTLKGTQTDDNNASTSNELYDATSSLKVFSLRLPFVYKYSFGSFGINTALDLLIPLYEMGPTQTATTPTTQTSTDQEDDLKTSLGHTKSSFAADLVLGVYYQF